MRVTVCSVGVGAHYGEQLDKLDRSLDDVGFTGERLLARDHLPKCCPSHASVPYGFKPYMLRLAQHDRADIVIWADAACVAVRPLDSLVRYIEEHGVYFHGPDHSTGMWTNDRVLEHFGMPRDDAMSIPMILAGTMGLDLRNQRARYFLSRWYRAAESGLFSGFHTNERGTESKDPRCLGHRHDQSVASLLIHELRLPMTQRFFRFANDFSGEPTFVAVGWGQVFP